MIEVEFAEPTYNCDTMVQECTCNEPHTLKEWVEWAMPYHGQKRLSILVNNYTTVLEAVNGKVTYCADSVHSFGGLFDIYEMRDTWGQVEMHLRLHKEPESANEQPEWCVTITA